MKILIFLLISTSAYSQVNNFGDPKDILFSFKNNISCFDFRKDQKFNFFYSNINDSGYICIEGNWKELKTDSGKIIVLKEEKKWISCNVTESSKSYVQKIENDTFYYPRLYEGFRRVHYGYFKGEEYKCIMPVKKFIFKTKVHEEYFSPVGISASSKEYLESKYNIKVEDLNNTRYFFDAFFFGRRFEYIILDYERAMLSFYELDTGTQIIHCTCFQ